MDNSLKHKAIKLTVLFVISYCAVGFFGALMTVYNVIQTGAAAAPTLFGGYHILVLVTVPLYFLPLAVKIQKLAKEAGMKILRGLSIFMIFGFSMFIFVNIIIIILHFTNPGFFA